MVFISSYMSSFPAWWACYLVSYAVVNGLTYMTPIHLAWMWFPEKPGYASGIIMSGYGISGLVWNNLALFLVNPGHVATMENGLYPPEIAKNVPYMLRTLAICYAVLVIVAVLLVFPVLDSSQPLNTHDVDPQSVRYSELIDSEIIAS
jgi:hypothetical protein